MIMSILQIELPQQLFTPESFGTLAGATAATIVITNTVQSLTHLNPKLTGFIVAMIVSFTGVILTSGAEVIHYVMAFFNGFLIYATATGTMQIIGKQTDTGKSATHNARRFMTKWW